MSTPWSVFQDGPNGEPTGRRRSAQVHEARRDGARCQPRSRRRRSTGMTTARLGPPPQSAIGPHPEVDRRTALTAPHPTEAHRRPHSLPPDNFKHSLTLFSKSFSSFLAVLVCYRLSPVFSLDGIYRPIGLHSQTTRLADSASWCDRVRHDGLSPLGAPSRGLGPGPPLRTLLQTTIERRRRRFSTWAVPARSPLLGNPSVAPPDLGRCWTPRGAAHWGLRARIGGSRAHGTEGSTTTDCRGARRRVLVIWANREPGAREASIRPHQTRWFTDSAIHTKYRDFATLFIGARAEISAAESRFDIQNTTQRPDAHHLCRRAMLDSLEFLARFAPGFVCAAGRQRQRHRQRSPKSHAPPVFGPPGCILRVHGSLCCAGFQQ
ncbi:hypothetical protein FNV43_RR20978 [Rhamnella rubrinervis]|uniref:Uncharacterized protein n=1 Tax=Rhamnella rubrinervis TaxID=2594499 RepID=A0A8K0E7J2_9ROSA|nr:hypothetical protein FNV43_RR20978 [Rhamnella rubrinervis]